MPVNAELSQIFSEMAAVLELTGANRFRVNAHQRVARVLKDQTTDIAELATDPKRLQSIDGIGEGTAKKIVEYIQTGEIKEHQELLREIPPGLLPLLKIPGLGPKTVKLLWEQAEVTDLASLKLAISEGKLEDLPRMGPKTIANITEAIEFAEKSGGRVRLGEALPMAERIVNVLGQAPGVRRISYAGSLRRGRETIGDVDILACCDDAATLVEAFKTMEGVSQVLAAGETKSSVRLNIGVQVDLRIVPEDAYGAALMYFTGSKEHNVRLRERAIKRGMRLNEYGLFPDDKNPEPPQKRGVKPVESATEEAIYAALELPWIPPELREDRGELENGAPPEDLIDVADIVSDLHMHTVASDGRMSIEELVEIAKGRGYHTVAITDHSKSSAQAGGLDETRLRRHIDAVHEVNGRTDGITVLAGSEVDILSDGRLDYDDDLLAELDIVVASPHVALRQPTKKATERLLEAIAHPLVHIVAHPTGRIINGRPGLEPDMQQLAAAAVEHDTALEINANYVRLDLRDMHVRAVVEARGLIAINTDSHTPENFDQMRFGVATARRGWLRREMCVNAWPEKKLHAWLRSKRDG